MTGKRADGFPILNGGMETDRAGVSSHSVQQAFVRRDL